MDSPNNNHDYYHGNHDDRYDNYKFLPLLTDDDVNTNNYKVNAIYSSSTDDDQLLQNSPAFANHNLPHAVIHTTFHDQVNAIYSSSTDVDQLLQNSPAFANHNLPHAVIHTTFHDQAPRNSEVANVNDETTVNVKITKVETSKGKKRKHKDAKPVLPKPKPKPKDDKAINFPISSLEIGSWKRQAKHNEDLVARCYFNKTKLAWEVLDKENHKQKLEFFFSDIDAINSVITPEKGLLYIRLKIRPTFHHDVNREAKRHTSWQDCADFTDGEATRIRVHKLEIAPRDLRKHYNNIIKYDNKLLELSKKKFPEKESSLFDDVHCNPYINSMNNQLCILSEPSSNFWVPPQMPLTPQGYGIDPINAISIQHTESGRNWPEDNISHKYVNHDCPTRNYTIDIHAGQVYDNSDHQHLESTIPPVLPPLNKTTNAHGRPQEWSPLVYPGFGTSTPAPLNDEHVYVPALSHAGLNDFSSNTSVDLMQIQLRYMEEHGPTYNDNQLQRQASINHDVSHMTNEKV